MKESLLLRFLYHTVLGRIILKVLTMPIISKIIGWFLNLKISKIFIKPFVRKNNINLNNYEKTNYHSFNDFFTRKIKTDLRPIGECFISPCDGYLKAYNIKEDLVLSVKQSTFTITSLLKDKELASIYKDGLCLVFRLTPTHYHRYHYLDSGTKLKNIFIKGRLHTVRSIALEKYPVFTENSREYTVLNTNNYGKIVQVEVGALLVGKISNNHQEYEFTKGEEKGMFLFGGSTIILLVEKDKVKIDEKYFDKEIEVKMGERIGE